MNSAEKNKGIGLLCDCEGRVHRILHNTLSTALQDCLGRSFFNLVDAGSAQKARYMLAEVQKRGAAFNWELSIEVDGKITSVHFAGGLSDDSLLIVGSPSLADIAPLYENMMRINNEQINALRSLMKEQASTESDSRIYDDMTRLNNELAHIQRELAKKNVQLEQLNEQKNQFLGMASHDLRNPLSIIEIYSSILLKDLGTQVSDKHLDLLDAIRSSSSFMLSLVEDLLNVSKIEAGRLELNLQSVELTPMVERNITLNRVFAERKSITIDIDCPEDIPTVYIDLPKIEQVLNNLLSNAIKYSQSDTAICVRLYCQEAQVIVAVQDQGQGIPAEELDGLFEAFQKTSVKSTAGERSTGLGLMIARRIIEGHGGRIWVESTVGVGSTFSFSLPTTQEKPAPTSMPAAPTPAPTEFSPLHILLVEDDLINQKIVVHTLEKSGHTVRVVENGALALAALNESDFDAVLMDIEMPVMGGMTATRTLRAREQTTGQHMPVIALTAHTDTEQQQQFLHDGIDACLTKPIDRETMLATLEKILHAE